MDLFDVARSCARRWYILAPLLLIVLIMSYYTYSSVKPVYYSNAVIGLTPPNTRIVNAGQGEPVPRNGLLDVGGAPFIASMTAVGLQKPTVMDKVVAGGGVPNYVVKMFPTAANMQQLPLIMIEVSNIYPELVTKTLELVTQEADETLQGLQEAANVPPDQMVTAFIVAPPRPPRAEMPSRTRSTVALLIAGVGLSLLGTVILDVLLTRRKARKAQQSALSTAADDSQPRHADVPTDAPADVPADIPTDNHQPDSAVAASDGAHERR